MTNYWHKRNYAEASTEPDGLAKRGYVYSIGEFFTITAGGTASFEMLTNGNKVEFQYYSITTSIHPVKGFLYEGGTATAGTYTVTPRNLNRNHADTSAVTLTNATSRNGGTIIATELVGSGSKAGGAASSTKVITLKDNERYVMSFVNTGNQDTLVHFDLGWSESDPDPKPLWET